MMPCVNICIAAPSMPAAVPDAMPITTNPMWPMELYATIFLRSFCVSASAAP